MATIDNQFDISIDSILGGQSLLRNFAKSDQYLSSLAIDPDQPSADSGIDSWKGSGYIRPVPAERHTSADFLGTPRWMITNPKDANIYVYDSAGSVYTMTNAGVVTGLADLTEEGGATGNGAEYYDNYIYFARNTTVARYGPLNGAPVWAKSWLDESVVNGGIAHSQGMSNTTYPTLSMNVYRLPNHVMLRHNDGAMYITDVQGNQGYIHKIKTTKTTVEGDTDNGSALNQIDFPYGFWPTAMATFGDEIAIALYEGSGSSTIYQRRAKLVFWDPTNTTVYSKLVDIELPDEVITAMVNANGTLYIFSGQIGSEGCRVSRFVGGYSLETVAFIPDSEPPFAGAVDHVVGRILFGGTTIEGSPIFTSSVPSVWALGSKVSPYSGIYNVMSVTASTAATAITSLKVATQDGLDFQIPFAGWGSATRFGIDKQGTNYANVTNTWRSQVYRIGQPFKITKIKIPVTPAMTTDMAFTVKIYVDNGSTATSVLTVNNTTHSGKRSIVLRPNGLTGQHNFFLEITFSGAVLTTVMLPIKITGETQDE